MIGMKCPPLKDEIACVHYRELDRIRSLESREFIRYKFLLGSACRDKEVTYAAWTDRNFFKKRLSCPRQKDVGFTPKSHESRE